MAFGFAYRSTYRSPSIDGKPQTIISVSHVSGWAHSFGIRVADEILQWEELTVAENGVTNVKRRIMSDSTKNCFPTQVIVRRIGKLGITTVRLVTEPVAGTKQPIDPSLMNFAQYSTFSAQICSLANSFTDVRGTITLGTDWQLRGDDQQQVFTKKAKEKATVILKYTAVDERSTDKYALRVSDCCLSYADGVDLLKSMEEATQMNV